MKGLGVRVPRRALRNPACSDCRLGRSREYVPNMSRARRTPVRGVCRLFGGGSDGGRHDVGARQRPNTGANQRGRASLSSSAGRGGASGRLGIGDAIEALLDCDDRPRYRAIGIDPTARISPPSRPSGPGTGDSWLAPALRLKSVLLGSDQTSMNNANRLPVKAGPVPDKLTIWPVDDGRYGLQCHLPGCLRLPACRAPSAGAAAARWSIYLPPGARWRRGPKRFGPFRASTWPPLCPHSSTELRPSTKHGGCGIRRICQGRRCFARRSGRPRRSEHALPARPFASVKSAPQDARVPT